MNNLTLDGGNNTRTAYGIHLQNQTTVNTPARTVDFKMSDCVVQNYTNKGIYLVNVTSVNINNVEVANCASVPDPYPDEENLRWYISGDYAIDIDVTGTVCSEIRLSDITFAGKCGLLGAIKIAQRGGAGDSDKGVATIEEVYLSNLDFDGIDRSYTTNDVRIGNEPDAGDGYENLRDYNSEFPIHVDASTQTSISVWGGDRHGEDNLILDLAPGANISTTPSHSSDGPGTGTGSIQVNVISGYAMVSGKLGSNMSMNIADGASVNFSGFENTGGNTIYVEDGADISGDAGDNVYQEPPAFVPGFDDDEEYIPPIVPAQPSDSGDDDTTTIVACAAAAVVAALMAAFLIIERRGN